MPYALLDEDFHSNPKMLALGNDGTGLYARGLSYCAHYQTDGFVPHSWANAAAENRRSLLAKLIDQLAWLPLAKGGTFTTTDRSDNTVVVSAARERGYIVADYFDYNPSSAERAAASAKKAAAGRAGATRRWGRGSRHSTSHSNGIADAIADSMANGWQNDGTPRARPPSPTPKSKPRAVTSKETTREPDDANSPSFDVLKAVDW